MGTALVIQDGDVYSPEKLGVRGILSIHGKIIKLGDIDRRSLDTLGIDHEVLDAKDAYVIPGFIDPHEHLIGGDGEGGFSARCAVIQLPEVVSAGITTVVGCLGTDVSTYHIDSLLAHVRSFNEEGITAYLWSSGYSFPPKTLTDTLRNDLIYIPEIIGAGEVAVSDLRSSQPKVEELAKLVADTYVGGLLTQKCGVTHFHMGDGKKHLRPLFDLLENYDVDPTKLFPTHVGRNDELLRDACRLSRMGVAVNHDTTEEDLTEFIKKFQQHEGNFEQLSFSTDASLTAPMNLYTEFKKIITDLGWGLEKALPFFTTHTAKVLKLPHKGSLRIDSDADLVVLDKDTLRIRHVVARGKVFVKDGRFIHRLKFLEGSNRKVELYGEKTKGVVPSEL